MAKLKIGHKYVDENGEIPDTEDGPDIGTSEGRKQIIIDIIEEFLRVLVPTGRKDAKR